MKHYLHWGVIVLIVGIFSVGTSSAQDDSETVLDAKTLQALLNEVSGALPYYYIIEVGGYPRDRKPEEYEGTYFESQYTYNKAKEYGFTDVRIERWPESRPLWDGEVGELWMVEPEEKLIISYRDVTTALAPNSSSGEWTGELVYVGYGTKKADYEGKDVKGKFVLGKGSLFQMYNLAVKKDSAAGVITFGVHHPFEIPDKIFWSSLPTRLPFHGMAPQDTIPPPKAFGFNISPRIGEALVKRLSRLRKDQKIIMKAIVKASERKVDHEVVTALIPGDGSTEEEIVVTAHLFEGIHKQGAGDDFSGCAAILEAGRTLIKLINEGKISRPARNIRFLWVPEIRGSFLYLIRYPEETKHMVADINLDMVGEDVRKNHNSLLLYRNLHSRTHSIDDIAAALFDWVGKHNQEWLSTRASSPLAIIDPLGSQDPFYYNIMPYSGGSDHMVFQLQDFKIPAVFFNNWPDMAYHTNYDRPENLDPTQLKRAAFLAAALTVAIGGGKETDAYRLAVECYGRSLARVHEGTAAELRALSFTADTSLVERYRDARYIIEAHYARETQSLNSLHLFTQRDEKARTFVNNLIKQLHRAKKLDLASLDEGYRTLCESRGLKAVKPKKTELEKEMASLIPVDVPKEWPSEEDEEALWKRFSGPRVYVKGIGRNQSMELRYFIDGKRTMLDIRNAVSAEFGPIPIKAVREYFKKLEEEKYITVKKK